MRNSVFRNYHNINKIKHDDNTNQYFSIDVLKPNAPVDTSAPNKILHTLFAPDQGPVQMRAGAAASPQMNRGWTPAEWTVAKRYRGKRVQLRLIVSVSIAPLQAGIDDVRIGRESADHAAALGGVHQFTAGETTRRRPKGKGKGNVP